MTININMTKKVGGKSVQFGVLENKNRKFWKKEAKSNKLGISGGKGALQQKLPVDLERNNMDFGGLP